MATSVQPARRSPPPTLGRRLGAWVFIFPLVLVLTAAFFIPNLVLLFTSFFKSQGGVLVPEFTMGNYVKFFTDAYFLKALFRTFGLGIAVGGATVVIGYPVAYFLVRGQSRWKGLFLACVMLPILASVVVRTYGWQVLLEEKGLINTLLLDAGLISQPIPLIRNFVGVMIGLTHVELPYAVLSIMSALQGIDSDLEKAAKNLGAGPVRTFFQVTFPLSLPGVAAGFLLPFAATVSAYASPRILGGRKMETTGTLVYSYMMDLLDWPFAATISVVVVVTVVLALYLLSRFSATREGGEL